MAETETETEIITNSILTLEEFPDEILFKVLDYLNIDDLFICTHVSRRISEICNDALLWHKKIIGKFVTGKSLSEAPIFASTNPKYDNRLFMELPRDIHI